MDDNLATAIADLKETARQNNNPTGKIGDDILKGKSQSRTG